MRSASRRNGPLPGPPDRAPGRPIPPGRRSGRPGSASCAPRCSRGDGDPVFQSKMSRRPPSGPPLTTSRSNRASRRRPEARVTSSSSSVWTRTPGPSGAGGGCSRKRAHQAVSSSSPEAWAIASAGVRNPPIFALRGHLLSRTPRSVARRHPWRNRSSRKGAGHDQVAGERSGVCASPDRRVRSQRSLRGPGVGGRREHPSLPAQASRRGRGRRSPAPAGGLCGP